ncbi:MAG: NAD(P)-dependent oxidoreductase [Caldimonas sp.]
MLEIAAATDGAERVLDRQVQRTRLDHRALVAGIGKDTRQIGEIEWRKRRRAFWIQLPEAAHRVLVGHVAGGVRRIDNDGLCEFHYRSPGRGAGWIAVRLQTSYSKRAAESAFGGPLRCRSSSHSDVARRIFTMILVTGGTGFVGQALAAELIRQRREVRVLSRQPGVGNSQPLPAGVDLVVADLGDVTTLGSALRSVDTLVHLAGALDGSSAQLRRANVEAAANIAQAARDAGTRWFVHVSSAGVYGSVPGDGARTEHAGLDAATPYELSKRDGEAAIQDILGGSSTGHVVLRPAGIYGGARLATQRFLRDIAGRRLWVRAPPSVIVHPTYVDDLVQAILRVVDRRDVSGEVFNIGGERCLSLDQWAGVVADAMGLRLRQVAIPAAPCVATARTLCRLSRALRIRPADRLVRACEPTISRALETGKARSRLGFMPTPFDQAVAQTIAQARALGAL